jgi:signal transduction histidine kinase
MKLWDITTGIKELELMLEQEEITEEEMEDMMEVISVEMEDKMESVVGYMLSLKDDMEQIKSNIQRLSEIKKTKERALERMKSYVKSNMEKLDKKKIETSIGNVSLRKTTKVIVDEEKIDFSFKTRKVVWSVNKTEIKKAIKSGEKVEGAYIEENKSLSIK